MKAASSTVNGSSLSLNDILLDRRGHKTVIGRLEGSRHLLELEQSGALTLMTDEELTAGSLRFCLPRS